MGNVFQASNNDRTCFEVIVVNFKQLCIVLALLLQCLSKLSFIG